MRSSSTRRLAFALLALLALVLVGFALRALLIDAGRVQCELEPPPGYAEVPATDAGAPPPAPLPAAEPPLQVAREALPAGGVPATTPSLPSLGLELDIREPDGEPAASALVYAKPSRGMSRGRSFTWTPTSPELALPAGKYELSAHSVEGGTRWSAARRSETKLITLREGRPHDPVRLDLRVRPGIAGVVLATPGDPAPGKLLVHLVPLARGQPADPRLLGEPAQSTWLRDGDRFLFQDLAPGLYLVGAARDWDDPAVGQRVVEVGDGRLECELALPPIPRGGALRVLVRAPDGRLLEQVEFEVRAQRGGRWWNAPAKVQRDGDGAHLLQIDTDEVGRRDETGPITHLELKADHDDYCVQRIQFEPGTRELTLDLLDGGTLELTVVELEGRGLEQRLRVEATPLRSDAHAAGFLGVTRGSVNADGIATFTRLAPGSHRIALELRRRKGDAFDHQYRQLVTLELEVAPGMNSAQLRVPTFHALHVRSALRGRDISLRSIDSPEMYDSNALLAKFDAAGRATFEELPAGEYLLATDARSVMRVSVPCAQVEFVPMEIGALRVVVLDRTGYFVELGLEDGDLIVGVNGVEFAGDAFDELERALGNPQAPAPVLLVERGEERLELVIDLERADEAGGVALVPVAR